MSPMIVPFTILLGIAAIVLVCEATSLPGSTRSKPVCAMCST
ncbi:MAG: hypothetical protein VCF24_13800 [Candidatus Latescibacterota bacterium]